MDLLTAIRSEIIRPLVTLVIPGLVGCSPFFFAILEKYPKVKDLDGVDVSPSVWLLLLSILAGMVFENWGAIIEIGVWKLVKWRSQNLELDSEWNQYLRLRLKDEIVGQRYLTSILIRVKFEYSMIPAAILFGIGANWLNHTEGLVSRREMSVVTILVAFFVVYLFVEVWQSTVVLANARRSIIQACKRQRLF